MPEGEGSAPRRRPLVAGNWKMYKTVAEVEPYVSELLPLLPASADVEVGLCVPYTALAATAAAVRGTDVRVAAQNMHQDPEGGFTGEVSAPMLLELGVQVVVLGHSERRGLFGETDRALQEKVPAALEAGLQPILCVGESEEERDAGETQRRLRHQVQEAIEKVPDERLGQMVIAYEPVWAIGSGRSASPEQAQEAIAFVRALVGDRSEAAAQAVRVLYGGSVKGENADELLSLPDVDGALVGGASLDPSSLAAIAAAASARA
jgi:triosephosphate isomerase